jgi:mono/diheme cytochrome c family protein
VEAWLARRALDASLRRAVPPRPNPVAPADAALLQGMRLYRNNCAGCHGAPGEPSRWGAAHFYPRVPQFADAPPERSEAEIFWIVRRGLRYSGMGGWSEMMSEEATWKIAAFLARVRSLPPPVTAEWKKR